MPADPAEAGKDGLSVIIVGVDGGDPAINAAAWAAGLARRERATLVLVYVEPITNPAYWTPVVSTGAIDAGAAFADELRAKAAHFLATQEIEWEVVHHRGDPAHALEAVAEEYRADCIVVGRSHEGAGTLGSVAKALINLATRPVVVLP